MDDFSGSWWSMGAFNLASKMAAKLLRGSDNQFASNDKCELGSGKTHFNILSHSDSSCLLPSRI